MYRMKLATILAGGPAQIVEISARLARREAQLDASGVTEIGEAELAFLLASIPADWDFVELGEVIDPASLSPELATQLSAWLDRRHGREPSLVLSTVAPDAGAEPLPPLVPEPSDPAPYPGAHVRGRLEDLVVRQLLGPWDGPEEVVDESSVRGRYLVGMLAPRGSSGLPEEYDDNDPGGSDGEDGITDAPAPKAATAMLPSSIGLTFAVSTAAAALQVTARWGRYERVEVQDERFRKPDGSYRLVWKRVPMEGTLPPLPLKEGKLRAMPPCSATPEVTIQGRIRKRAHEWIVTLFLVNGQEEPKLRKDSAWVFQPELIVAAPDGKGIFQRRSLPHAQHDPEEQQMAMLYRNQVEFAVGHGVAVDAQLDPGRADCAVKVWTSIIPSYEVPQITPPTAADYPALAGLTIDMQALADVPDGQFHAHLGALAEGYATWIEVQEQRLRETESGEWKPLSAPQERSAPPDPRSPSPDPSLLPYLEVAKAALANCRQALQRIRAGIELLDSNPQAAAAFRFANRAMALQRVRALYAQAVRRGEKRTPEEFDIPKEHSWRAFQLGFFLLNLPGLTDLAHPDRALAADDPDVNPATNVADLLWFPTGGGKTEAYLGLTAYTLAIRRLQGVVGDRNGMAGVAVLMRYTLRLLTLQQFQRAAALICACEVIRREDPARWGDEPFRIGLWVGQRSTPNWVKDADEAIRQFKKGASASGGTPYQLKHCPWCGTAIEPGRDLAAEPPEQGRSRVLTYCGSLMSGCPFTYKQAPGEGLPVMVVDEEIYHRLPSLLIATVDKFAQMPWNGRTAALFGRVSGYCERHGYLTPDMEHNVQSHPAIKAMKVEPARVQTQGLLQLRPPDLIIQDELHLISGPLGTLVGLYETAVDQLATWRLGDKRIRPKVIASTATIRRAAQQVHSIFLRDVNIFPPQGLDAGHNFFSVQRPPSDDYPGRRYLGICAPGVRHKTALIQSYVAFLAAAQQLYEEIGKGAPQDIDPYMTLVGYFNALRELAAMRRASDDTVSTRLKKMNQRGLVRRFLDPWNIQELTSRLSASDIPEMLDRLETPFDPNKKVEKGGRRATKYPIDVLLATNMISVGVDVGRLGLMVVGGQPKATAEYIQATSRVGRSKPGLVATVYNWARPRDLSHYERFKHYHATFYQYVEALSVTPFSPRAVDRGLSAVLVAMARLNEQAYNPNHGAGKLAPSAQVIRDVLAAIVARAGFVADSQRADLVKDGLKARLDHWANRATATIGAKLGYRRQEDGSTVGLLETPGNDDWNLFACLNSLRDVEPTVNLVLDDGGLDGVHQPWSFTEKAVAAPAETEE